MAHSVAGRLFAQETVEPFLEGTNESLLFERLFDEVDRTRLHRLDRETDIAVTRHDDDRQADAFALKGLLDFQSIHSSHSDVEQDAAFLQAACGFEKRHSIFIRLHAEAGGLQHEANAAADRLIVIDQVYYTRIRVAHRQPRLLAA